jgi:hypothetical protein
MAYQLSCESQILTDEATGQPICTTGWIQAPYVPPFDSSQIDPSVVAALIGAGFLLYLTPWVSAFGISAVLKLLK